MLSALVFILVLVPVPTEPLVEYPKLEILLYFEALDS